MLNKKILLILLMGAALLAGIGSALFKDKGNKPNNAFSSLGGEFELMSQAGPVKLSNFKGEKLVLMFFGYTQCPDVCPISLTNVARGIKGLSTEQAAQVQPIMISLDPKRDTPKVLADYVSFFNEDFIGLTGTKTQIDEVVQKYGAVYRIVELNDSAMGYGVDHSSRLYLMDKDGGLVKLLYHDSKPEEITQALVAILNQ